MSLTVKSFSDRLYDKARDKGADPTNLIDSHAKSLLDLSKSAANALNGDERDAAYLKAMFSLGKFTAEADAFIEARIWWEATAEVLKEIAVAGISTVATAAAQGLVESMKGIEA